MSTYICKCGKTFQKNTESGTTGFRMPDYGPDHECFGCPFALEVMTWDPVTEKQAVQNHECRGSKSIRYYTTSGINLTDKCTADIHTLDFDFLRQVHEFAETLEGFEPDRCFFDNRSSAYSTDGRFRYTLYPTQNQKGIAAKAALKERFFNPDGTRKDVIPEQEKEIVLNQIKEAKAMAQGIEPATIGKKYYHHNLVYFVDQREDNGMFTAFMGEREHLNPETTCTCATIPDFPNFEQAQNALDGYAIKRGFTDEPTEPPAIEQTTVSDESEDIQQDDIENDSSDFVSDDGDSADENNEMPDFDNDSGDSANGQPEDPQGPCDWKNASGADEEEDDPEEPESNIPAGEYVSLRDDAFSSLIDICDNKINQALRTMFELRQNSFSFTAKITFERRGDAFGIKHETGFNFDPIKVKDKGELYDEIPIQLDENGNPIIPYDRQHQINFDELQPGRVIHPDDTVKTTVDGNTGLVNEVHTGEESEKKLYPCDHHDCPFFGVDDDESAGCCFDPQVDGNDEGSVGDIWEAVNMNYCERPEISEAYHKNNPDEEGSDPDEDNEESATLPDSSESNTFEGCNISSCAFYDAASPHHCSFKVDAEHYGAPTGYPADEDDVCDSVEDYDCKNPLVLKEYKKIAEN